MWNCGSGTSPNCGNFECDMSTVIRREYGGWPTDYLSKCHTIWHTIADSRFIQLCGLGHKFIPSFYSTHYWSSLLEGLAQKLDCIARKCSRLLELLAWTSRDISGPLSSWRCLSRQCGDQLNHPDRVSPVESHGAEESVGPSIVFEFLTCKTTNCCIKHPQGLRIQTCVLNSSGTRTLNSDADH
jgi:hypothetical protein